MTKRDCEVFFELIENEARNNRVASIVKIAMTCKFLLADERDRREQYATFAEVDELARKAA